MRFLWIKMKKSLNMQKFNINLLLFLEKRQNLWTFGDNKVPLGNWIFLYLILQEGDNVLEIGCGKGLMWCENKDSITLFRSKLNLVLITFLIIYKRK